MLETVESVRQSGVLIPIIVRERKEGGYEIISGHRRKRAAELAGLTKIPAIVKKMPSICLKMTMTTINLMQ